MNQKPPSKEELIALGDEAFDQMKVDPKTIQMMRALWKLSVELHCEAVERDAPDCLH